MITAERMAAVDRNAAALGVPRKQLMESSGNAVAQVVREVASPGADIAIVAGRGNNGGDSFVSARFLDDYEITIHLVGRPESITTTIAKKNWEAVVACEYTTTVVRDSQDFDLASPDVIIDGLLGTGITGAPREPERSIIRRINASDASVVSVDVPSGLDANSGEAALAVEADQVVTFHDLKPGLVDLESVQVADIGIPPAAELFVGPGDLLRLTRDPQSHKGDHGRVFVIGGGPYTGAPTLAALASLRGGADLAFVAAPETIAREIQGFAADLIVEPISGDRLTPDHVPTLLDRAAQRDVVVLGPGLGEAPTTMDAVRDFLSKFEGRAVIDADALRVVPEVTTKARLVCTPHQGEFVEMGGERAEGWQELADQVTTFAADLGQTLLVKGAYDVVSDGKTTRINRTGNPGMTVGGTGDVLAGVTGAMLASLEPMGAGSVGAYVNGRAGDFVVENSGYGLLASDLLDTLPEAIWGEDRE